MYAAYRKNMDKNIARHVARVAFRSAANLTDLVPFLKEHCQETEYKMFLKALAKASATINLEVSQKVFAAYPELEQEFNETINKYGQLI